MDFGFGGGRNGEMQFAYRRLASLELESMQTIKARKVKGRIMSKVKSFALIGALMAVVAFAVVACSSPEPEIIEVERQVEVVKEVPVEVIKEVVVEKTVVVEKEVVKEIEVPGETVVVEKEVVVEIEVAAEMPKDTIVFSDLNWTSAQVQNRIAQYIVEEGYGYPTDVVFGSTLPLFQGLRRGDSHVTMEIWLPNQNEAWAEAQSMGEVFSVGESLGKDWQSSFVIPSVSAGAVSRPGQRGRP